MWGAFGNKPVDDDHCEVVTPKELPGRRRAAELQHRPRASAIAKDGMVYVADRENRRVQAFTTDGKFVKQIVQDRHAVRPRPGALGGCRPAIPVCRQRRQHRHRRSQGDGDCRHDQAARHGRRRPPHRDGFEGEHLRRGDGDGLPEADVQGDVDGLHAINAVLRGRGKRKPRVGGKEDRHAFYESPAGRPRSRRPGHAPSPARQRPGCGARGGADGRSTQGGRRRGRRSPRSSGCR